MLQFLATKRNEIKFSLTITFSQYIPFEVCLYYALCFFPLFCLFTDRLQGQPVRLLRDKCNVPSHRHLPCRHRRPGLQFVHTRARSRLRPAIAIPSVSFRPPRVPSQTRRPCVLRVLRQTHHHTTIRSLAGMYHCRP